METHKSPEPCPVLAVTSLSSLLPADPGGQWTEL